MNIYLGKHFEKYIKEQVKSGRYKNASEVVRQGLRELEEQEQLLKSKINEGLKSKSSKWDKDDFLKKAHQRMNQIEGNE